MSDEEPMGTALHPARTMPYAELLAGLEAARAAGLVWRRFSAEFGLALYVYTPRCVYEDGWNVHTLLARGLILDPAAEQIVATPFPKFFNLGERLAVLPELPFEAFEKLDGSLIIAFFHAGRWRAVTKGAFDSEQAVWARARLDAAELSALVPGTTYLFEAIYPENRIVVRYGDAALVMLAAYDATGCELDYDEVIATCARLGWPAAERRAFTSIADMVEHTRGLPKDREGLVIRFADGTRLKLKGDEYRRIHALISRCTPLAIWEAIAAGDDMAAIRRDLPEEFWDDFDEIVRLLRQQGAALEERIASAAAAVADLSDRELGLTLPGLPADVRSFLFPYRKAGNRLEGKSRTVLLRAIRLTGNALPGYAPSYALNRVLDEVVG